MPLNKDFIDSLKNPVSKRNPLSPQDKKTIDQVLKNPILWAEVCFPPKPQEIVYEDYFGKEQTEIRIVEGWLTRPWQAEVALDKHLKKVLRISRRSGKTLLSAVKVLHVSFVLGRGVLVIAPSEKQVAEIYETLHKQFIDPHPELFNPPLPMDKRNPYTIRFHNGGFINFITAGTQAGSKGNSIRGQGHGVGFIYIDEADYLQDADLESILAIPAQDPSMEVWLTSTPTGKRQKFYNLCTKPPPGWASFHKSAPEALPNWSKQMEEEYKAIYSPDGFAREFMAEFGEEAKGVFSKQSLDDALARGTGDFPLPTSRGTGYPENSSIAGYGYAEKRGHNPNVKRIVGVDWDKYGAGTQLLVLEAEFAQIDDNPYRDGSSEHKRLKVNPYTRAMSQPFDYIKVIHRKEIPKSQFTLTNAVKALIKINQDFQPDYFYLDSGYGEMQIETLQRIGIECKDPNDPNYRLHEKIVRVPFSAGVEVIDPVTRTPEKRRIKPEMVNLLVNKFDEGEIILSPFDKELHMQLVNYVVTKITASGEPKYGTDDPNGREHAVDALMLANWGLHEKFGKKKIESLLKTYVQGPIGERYEKILEQMQEDSTSPWKTRKDYLNQESDDVQADNVREDMQLARQGYMRPDQVRSSPGVPDTRADQTAILKAQTFFKRGGRGRGSGRSGTF